MEPYVREVLDHLKDYSTSLWDRINTYDDLARRAGFVQSRRSGPITYNYDTAVYYALIRTDQEKRAMNHAAGAQRISTTNWLNESLQKLVLELHALDRSQVKTIIEFRKAMEEVSKDTSLDYNQMIHLDLLQKIFFEEHFREYSFILGTCSQAAKKKAAL